MTATAPAQPARAGPAADAHGPPAQPPDRPLKSYLLLTGAFNAAFAAALVAGRDRLPERIGAGDLALMAVGTHKLSRLVAKDRVTSGIRAPFTRHQGDAGPAEVDDAARGRGLRRALGELLVCPYCLDQWVAGGFVAGIVLAPRPTRAVASVFAVVAGADALQAGYRALQKRT